MDHSVLHNCLHVIDKVWFHSGNVHMLTEQGEHACLPSDILSHLSNNYIYSTYVSTACQL